MAENKTHGNNAGLRKKLLAAMVLVPAAPFLLVLSLGYYYFTDSLESEAYARMSRIAADHRRVVQMFLDERLGDLAFAAKRFSYEQLIQPGTLAEVFGDLKAKSPAYADLGVFDQQGLHVAYQGPYALQGKSYLDAPWFSKVMEQGYYLSDVFLGIRQSPHFVVAVRASKNGKSWVLRATIDSMFFTDLVERVRVGKTGEAYILNSKGELQTERRSGGLILTKSSDSISELALHGQAEAFRRQENGGHEYVYATARLNSGKWLLVVRQELDDALSSLREVTYLGLIILLAGGAGIVTIAFMLTGSLLMRMEMADREKKELDQQLIMASRLAELGEMSAGFAHEINNPLQIIKAEQTLIQTILEEMRQRGELPQNSDTEDMLDSVAQIDQQVKRCGVITQSILKFARQKDSQPQKMDLAEFAPQIAEMVSKRAQVEGVALQVEAGSGLPMVYADPGQLQQVLLNLLNNAIDAAALGSGAPEGEVRLAVSSEDGWVLLKIMDNGPGISPENLEKIFRPFFTTKPVGKGTGLGLSVCYGIVEKMKGVLEVESREGQGAAFLVKLPACQDIA